MASLLSHSALSRPIGWFRTRAALSFAALSVGWRPSVLPASTVYISRLYSNTIERSSHFLKFFSAFFTSHYISFVVIATLYHISSDINDMSESIIFQLPSDPARSSPNGRTRNKRHEDSLSRRASASDTTRHPAPSRKPLLLRQDEGILPNRRPRAFSTRIRKACSTTLRQKLYLGFEGGHHLEAAGIGLPLPQGPDR